MDGVVADFVKGVVDLTGVKLTTSKEDHDKYDTMKESLTAQRLFRNLQKTNIADDIIDTLKTLRSQEYIVGFEMLTAAGAVNREIVVEDKNLWCQENGLEGVPVNCVFSGKQKTAFIAPKGVEISVLIDDRLDNCEAWKEAGGIAICIDDDTSCKIGDYIKEICMGTYNIV
tara:strand:+ start:283 stop:795 length:513 start_codon:yes stop_codon:yes gene_type:complete